MELATKEGEQQNISAGHFGESSMWGMGKTAIGGQFLKQLKENEEVRQAVQKEQLFTEAEMDAVANGTSVLLDLMSCSPRSRFPR